MKEQNKQQERSSLVKQKRQKHKCSWSIIHLCLGCLMVGAVCFAMINVATRLLFTSDSMNAILKILSLSKDQHILTPTEEKMNEMSKGYIVLDPGHGGEDSPGCIYDGILERDVTLELSFIIRDYLVQKGYTVLMTREADEMVTLEQRTQIANKSGADLLISIHLNAYEDTDVSGIETWFNPDTNNRSSALAEYIQRSISTSTKGKNRGTYPDTSLILIREVLIPSCLVEVGYLSNDEEREKMTTDAYRKKVAQGIFDGVEQYFERFPTHEVQKDL